jgi:hypothetical protein
VQLFLNIRLMQANALFGLIQQLNSSPLAQVPGSSVQSTIALYQAALANVQYQINQLQLLTAALNQAPGDLSEIATSLTITKHY